MTGRPVDLKAAALPALLTAVCLGIKRRRLLRHLGQAALFGVGVLGMQGLPHALYPAWNWHQALLLAGALALVLLTLLEGRAERVTPVLAARLTDRRLGLDDLLSTALSVPPPYIETTGRAAELALAMWTRLQTRAEQVAHQIRPEQVFQKRASRNQAGRWPLPVALLLLAPAALLLWLLPPLTLPRPTQAQAVAVPVGQTQASQPVSPSADMGAAAQAQARSAASPTAAQATPPSNTSAPSSQGPTLDGASTSKSKAAGVVAGGGRAPTQAFMRDSRNTLQGGGAATEATGDPGSVQNSPFGSRESGSLVNEQLPDNPRALAAAPYDPGSKGSGVVKQKSSGPTGLRAASGGRGVESDGDDRCVQGCLTNNDMNRGNQAPTAPKPKPPGGSTRSGTSSSGGGAAGSSSAVGLGTAQTREVSVTLRRQLLGGVTLNSERVQVLAAPDTPVSGGQTSTAAAQAGSWTRQPERLTPTDTVSAEARSAVQTYFRRTP